MLSFDCSMVVGRPSGAKVPLSETTVFWGGISPIPPMTPPKEDRPPPPRLPVASMLLLKRWSSCLQF